MLTSSFLSLVFGIISCMSSVCCWFNKEQSTEMLSWCVFLYMAIQQLWSRNWSICFPLKILEVEWDWWQSLGSVDIAPQWPGGIWTAPWGPLIRMLCVIRTSAMERVKTWLVFKGQASTSYRISTVLFARIMNMQPGNLCCSQTSGKYLSVIIWSQQIL